ncbi:ImmA/IrrE family metallo-endopeptidase [Blastococcus sp. KM273128]|uniref:helix-turn-helix domain-containing protein n=1 Tax=Blastococcus sp. KM273128 TaxID=2570314 RepID=UPI001F1FDEF6|nr:XRE family transcriptional regulator [Blastococcus sp. KM273128]
MTAPLDLDAARQRAIRRRAAGVAVDFDPARLTLARRLSARQRTQLAREVGVTPAAITQYEKGQSKPTLPVLASLSEALAVPVEFFRAGHQVHALPAGGAHFRSLRSTSALEREKALAFGEVALSVFAAVEQQVELPAPRLPDLPVSPELDAVEIADLAGQARARMGVARGPVPHVVRLLEAHGVAVVRLDDASHRVDAFSHLHGPRPLVMLNPAKRDKARSRFDAAHELGHLLMHHDTEPGSRLAEMQAHAFAAEFLAPAAQIADDLPTRPDWVTLHALKRRWGLSLKALVMRAHTLERFTEHSYRRALRQLSFWGLPEPGPLGAPEVPVLLPRAIDLLGGEPALGVVARDAGLPLSEVRRVWLAAGADDPRPTVDLDE